MRYSNRRIAFTVALIAMLAVSVNSAIASEDNERRGFCDCSNSGDLICHVPPGNHKNMHTIQVGAPAIDAHLAHGDMMGPCPGEDDSSSDDRASVENICTCEDGNIGILYHVPTPSASTPQGMRQITGK